MNKKLLVTLLFLLLTGWIAGSCYWYVCKIRKACDNELVENTEGVEVPEEGIVTPEIETPKIERPSFSITNGDLVISESTSNVSFGSGTAEIEIPKSMESSLETLITFLKKNPDKNLKINGLHLNSDNDDSLGIARANAMATYFENKKGIDAERIISSSKATSELYRDEETQKIIGGIEYEILSAKIDEGETQVDENNIDDDKTPSNTKIDPKLKKKVDGRKIMYYPLNNFEVEPTYELEKYFKNLKKYFDQNPDGLVQITGHTDATGDASGSLYDSKKYAEKVKNHLISKYKMNPRNFRTKGQGDTKPVTDSETNLGRAENRRIEFSFIK